jgi:hypothetical protein
LRSLQKPPHGRPVFPGGGFAVDRKAHVYPGDALVDERWFGRNFDA